MHRRGIPRRWLAAALVLLLMALGLGPLLRGVVTARVRAAAAARGLTASWTTLRLAPPFTAHIRELSLTRRTTGDTLFRAASLAISLDPWALLLLRPRVAAVSLAHADASLPATGEEADTLALDDPPPAGVRAPAASRAERVRAMGRSLVRLLAAPARTLPHLSLTDVTIHTGSGARGAHEGSPTGLRIHWLDLSPARGGVRLSAAGALLGERPAPFRAGLDYGRDDRITGGARFDIPPPGRGRAEPLRLTVDGALRQERRAGRVVIADTTRVTVGDLRFRLGGEAGRQGPRFRLALAADSLTAAQWKRSLPRGVLGPLIDLSVRGWYGYRVSLDLDLARPESVAFTADVLPRGLQIDPAATRLNLLALAAPFVARVHLPRGRVVERDLSPANPHFRPLPAIDSLLVRAVVTNEDGAFFRHGGFNTEAVKSAIADNIRAGAFRRGAGTITMQLVRNLYLGHARTLSRKGQEVVLAWVLEHLTPITKERMLEIYLNIIEWGPGVHGAEEAAWFYFGHDAGRLTAAEALFLATVVPAPARWRSRFDATGALRPFTRAQMHFIGRAMIRKGWLPPESLPPVDSLQVTLLGRARDLLFTTAETPADLLGTTGDTPQTPPDTAGSPADSTGSPADSTGSPADTTRARGDGPGTGAGAALFRASRHAGATAD